LRGENYFQLAIGDIPTVRSNVSRFESRKIRPNAAVLPFTYRLSDRFTGRAESSVPDFTIEEVGQIFVKTHV
jgi:hypothetical protein